MCGMCDQSVAREDGFCWHEARGERLGTDRRTKCNCLRSLIYRANGTIEWPPKEANNVFSQQHSSLAGTKLKQQLAITSQMC